MTPHDRWKLSTPTDLIGLCNDARKFWRWGPWLIPEPTQDQLDRHVVPFHYKGNPEIEALATPEIVQDALAMDRAALEFLNAYLRHVLDTLNADKEVSER